MQQKFKQGINHKPKINKIQWQPAKGETRKFPPKGMMENETKPKRWKIRFIRLLWQWKLENSPQKIEKSLKV